MGANLVVALDAICAIQKTVVATFDDGSTRGITAAYPFGEWNIGSLNCPFFINMLHGGPSNFQATGGLQAVDNVIDMYLCLQPTQQGRSRESSLRYVNEWRDVVFATFAAKMRLGGGPTLTFVKIAFIKSWEFAAVTVGATDYWALRFELELDESFGLAIGS